MRDWLHNRGSGWIDLSAMGLSGLCLVHCLAGTLAVVLASALTTLPGSPHLVHIVLLGLAGPLAVFSFWRGWRLHRQRINPVLGATGLALMALALTQEHGQRWEVGITMIGVALLAVGHWRNYRTLVEQQGCHAR